MRSIFETIWDSIASKVPMQGTRNIGEHEGGVAGQGFREYCGQSGECIVSANSDARDGAIGEDENGSDGVDMLLDLSRNTPLVELVLLKPAGISQPRSVENANLGERLFLLPKHSSTY